MGKQVVYTVGYGGRGLEELIKLLKLFGVECIVDVRRWAKGSSDPAYSSDNLSKALRSHGIEYFWFPELGGYRRFGVDVDDYGVANCFRAEGFRAYATYIVFSPRPRPYLEKLVEIASKSVAAVMCCERIPWRCHRKILSDYLVAKGFRVIHIVDENKVYEHRLSRCAKIVNGSLTYV